MAVIDFILLITVRDQRRALSGADAPLDAVRPLVILGQCAFANLLQRIAQAVALRAVGWSLQEALDSGAAVDREALQAKLEELGGRRPLLHAGFVYQVAHSAFKCPSDPMTSAKDFFASYTLHHARSTTEGQLETSAAERRRDVARRVCRPGAHQRRRSPDHDGSGTGRGERASMATVAPVALVAPAGLLVRAATANRNRTSQQSPPRSCATER